MALLYSNENFPIPVVDELKVLGHDVVTIQDRKKAGEAVPDEEVLQFAIAENRAIITLNRKDFIQLHRKNPEHHGIIVCTFDPDFKSQAKRIDEEIKKHTNLEHCNTIKRRKEL